MSVSDRMLTATTTLAAATKSQTARLVAIHCRPASRTESRAISTTASGSRRLANDSTGAMSSSHTTSCQTFQRPSHGRDSPRMTATQTMSWMMGSETSMALFEIAPIPATRPG